MAWTTPGTAVAGNVLTAAFWNEQVRDNMNSLVAAGTVLPSTPVDGESFYYIADATNGVVWHLRYRAAATGSYKWEFVGGPALSAEITGEQITTSTTYTDLATAGPSITLPLGGDYLVTIAARMINTSNNQFALMSYAIGASAAADADAINILSSGTSNGPIAYSFRERRKTGLGAVTLTMKYKSSGGGTCGFTDRFIRAIPIRVG
jgi:hypothetical protein